MKFGKSLTKQIEETIPESEWRDKFISYKDLKKRLKLLGPYDGERPGKRQKVEANDAEDCEVAGEEIEDGWNVDEVKFIRLLEDELEKFNDFFLQKEEGYMLRLEVLEDRVADAKDSNEEILQIRRAIVDFHGEMVLLENYSALNFLGLVKILKKFDKRTGALIRLPFIQKVLQQPFLTTDILDKFVKKCETMLDSLSPLVKTQISTEDADREDGEDGGLLSGPKELAEIEYMKSFYTKKTISALKALIEIRSKSSTVSPFSLPPLQINGLDM